MANELYFIPIIERALRASDRKTVLVEAFKTIEDLGQQDIYRQGYQQFHHFMELTHEIHSNRENSTDEAMMDWFETHPDWKELFKQWEDEQEVLLSSEKYPSLVVERDGEPCGHVLIHTIPSEVSIGHLLPGRYVFRLDTGRILWEGELTDEDLLWEVAFPHQPLELAADTGREERQSRPDISLLGNELIARIIPGVESGAVQFIIRNAERV